MKIGELIKAFRETNNLSQRQFAEIVGVSNGYISMLEDNRNRSTGEPITPNITTLKKIASGMNVTLNELMNKIEDTPVNVSDTDTSIYDIPGIRPIKLKRFRMLGEIACGKPIFANEDHESYIDASAYIKADFCLTACGDSMIGARINDGDVVFIKEQDMVDNGEIAAVIIDDEATLKRVYYYPEDNKLILTAENSKYPPLIYIKEQLNNIRILGKAVCFMSGLR